MNSDQQKLNISSFFIVCFPAECRVTIKYCIISWHFGRLLLNSLSLTPFILHLFSPWKSLPSLFNFFLSLNLNHPSSLILWVHLKPCQAHQIFYQFQPIAPFIFWVCAVHPNWIICGLSSFHSHWHDLSLSLRLRYFSLLFRHYLSSHHL